jgi:hypothetical protein
MKYNNIVLGLVKLLAMIILNAERVVTIFEHRYPNLLMLTSLVTKNTKYMTLSDFLCSFGEAGNKYLLAIVFSKLFEIKNSSSVILPGHALRWARSQGDDYNDHNSFLTHLII